MQADFWLERWQNNEIGFHQAEVNLHLQDHWPRLRAPSGGTVFVPLCGKTRDMLWLRAQGYGILGVELSPIAVRDFFAENRLNVQVTASPPFDRWEADGVTLLRGDFFDLTSADMTSVVGVYDRASIIALPPQMRERYVSRLADILPAGVETLLVSMEYPQHEMAGPPFSVSEDAVRELYERQYIVEHLYSKDILNENPNFRRRGLTRLSEQIFHIQPRG
ncbi:MAG: thiopurine S-methyltransferase [Acidiferrobacterales bacterium]